LTYLVARHGDGIGQVPVEVCLPREDRARIAAAHAHDDVGPPDVLFRDRLRVSIGEVDAELLHRLEDLWVQLLLGTRPRRAGLAAEPLVERLRHLGASRIADADEV